MPRHPVADGVLRALALAPGAVPLGLVFGATAAKAGFTAAQTALMYVLVFAGGTQLAAVGVVAAGGSALAAVGVVLVVNARYLLLSAATVEMGRRLGARLPQRVALALGTIDEAYALQAAAAKEGAATVAGLVAIPFTLMAVLVASTLVGATVGERLPDLEPFGLDYALPGVFVGLFGIFADSRPRLLAGLAAVAAGAALALAGFGTLAVLLVPPILAFALGRWAPRDA